MSIKATRRMGKSEARTKFLPLIQTLSAGSSPVEITERGRTAAVLMSYQDYQWLIAHVEAKTTGGSLEGSMLLEGDLEEGSANIAGRLRESIEQRSRTL